MNNNHLSVNITQKAVIVVNNKLLMLFQDGDWELPGGRVEVNEKDLITALKREVKEELSMEIEVGGIFTAYLFTKPTGEVSLAIAYRCKLVRPEESIKPQPEEVDDWKFYSKEELKKLKPVYANSVDAVEKFLLG